MAVPIGMPMMINISPKNFKIFILFPLEDTVIVVILKYKENSYLLILFVDLVVPPNMNLLFALIF